MLPHAIVFADTHDPLSFYSACMFAHTSTENAHIRAHILRRGAISGRTTFRRDGRVPSTPLQMPSTLRKRPREKHSGSTQMPPPSPCHHDTMRGRSEKTRSASCRSTRRGIESSTPTRGSHTISTRRQVKRAGRNRNNTKRDLRIQRRTMCSVVWGKGMGPVFGRHCSLYIMRCLYNAFYHAHLRVTPLQPQSR